MTTSLRLRDAALALSAALSFTALVAQPAAAGEPQHVPFQGRLSDAGGAPVTATDLPVTFRLWSAANGGQLLYTESTTVDVYDGALDALIGTSTTATGCCSSSPSPASLISCWSA